MKSIDVLHFLAPGSFGGLESVVHALATAQARSGLAVAVAGVFADEPRDNPFWEALGEGGIQRFDLVLPGRQYREERLRLAAIIEEYGVSVLHTHGYRSDVMGLGVARRLGIPAVTTAHGFIPVGLRNRIYEWLQRRAMRKFDAVAAVSGKLRDQLLASGVPPGRVHLIRNALAPMDDLLDAGAAREALGLPPEGPVVGWIGRLSEEKGPEVMLQAAALLDAPTRLCFVGEGGMRQALEASAEGGPIRDRVHFLGRVAHARRYLRAFDVLAMSSWTEGTPIVLLEAMAAGVPVVTTAVGGIPDVVSPSEALLVPPGNPDALAAALVETLTDREAAGARAGAAHARIEAEFQVDPWARRYAALYDACRAARRG